MDLQKLEYFIAAAKYENMTKAAGALYSHLDFILSSLRIEETGWETIPLFQERIRLKTSVPQRERHWRKTSFSRSSRHLLSSSRRL